MIHHVLLACPPESEDRLRGFYVDVLGFTEKPKPASLAARGGCWFTGYGIELHLGVEADFRPQRKAHPGLMWPSLSELATRLTEAGYPVDWSDELMVLDPPLRRIYTEDPHGNRLEFLEPA
ncbi:MAG TPA: glyoxalase [Micromonosporaceae bacterium]|jgi:catechol 2,3-dioxygenase-like lactoylglutathione lyase family enzyme